MAKVYVRWRNPHRKVHGPPTPGCPACMAGDCMSCTALSEGRRILMSSEADRRNHTEGTRFDPGERGPGLPRDTQRATWLRVCRHDCFPGSLNRPDEQYSTMGRSSYESGRGFKKSILKEPAA